MQNTTDPLLVETLTEENFVQDTDFAIDPHSGKILLLTERVRDRVWALRPQSKLSPVLVQESEHGWECVSSLDSPISPTPELADGSVHQFLEALFVS